jgi:hypothetical protein
MCTASDTKLETFEQYGGVKFGQGDASSALKYTASAFTFKSNHAGVNI